MNVNDGLYQVTPPRSGVQLSKEFQNELLDLFKLCYENHTDSMTLTFEYSKVKMAVEMTFKVEKVEK